MEKVIPKITTFLMFSGQAEEAMEFYTSLFEDSRIENIVHNEDGTVMQAAFTLNGQMLMCIDSPVNHEFTFTPAISLYVTCDSAEEIDRVFAQLSEGGGVLMPLDEYPFSKKFGWLVDRFGVSWQLNY
ncbi:VOC family protein [Planococcus shenhongbingii]|uniref:VOC family protein n=1 Tax=Planococcus shenhongbingii TaxID=3058398 RepID=A0ABT8NGF0_9BACL|nr:MULTISPECIES: VOC family protein [unclassified Planococcus (in: firmicutes)]MDN7246863.1 VOC family protein [Planococcus sp. N017]WKA58782.1 VOC family protein [Planococcus sp. N016]